MPGPPLPSRTIEQRLPVHARLGNRDLINLTVKKEVKGKACMIVKFPLTKFWDVSRNHPVRLSKFL